MPWDQSSTVSASGQRVRRSLSRRSSRSASGMAMGASSMTRMSRGYWPNVLPALGARRQAARAPARRWLAAQADRPGPALAARLSRSISCHLVEVGVLLAGVGPVLELDDAELLEPPAQPPTRGVEQA